ncbi:MAG: ugtP 1 [Firmicutes bacterium]|nr:ugtP 1 [Bacillota bacterium]
MAARVPKVLVVSASVGAGHDQAAKAVAAGIERRCEAEIEIVDFMGAGNSYLNMLVKEAYLKVIGFSPNLYELLYRWAQTPQRYFKVQDMVARTMKRAMLRLCQEYRPNIVICTHPFPLSAAAYLRKNRMLDATLIAIMTDFSVHPLWVYSEVDNYFVATREMERELIKQGIAAGRVYSTGIPIGYGFSQAADRVIVQGELGFDKDVPTVLFMGGGLGLGPVEEAIKGLNAGEVLLQIIAVAGKNAALQRQLEMMAKASRQRMVVTGYTQRVRELMAAADILITKPGALTLSEALASALPMVLFNTIPGQEEENAKFVIRNGAALAANGVEDMNFLISDLVANPNKLEKMKLNAQLLGRPGAADDAAVMISNIITCCRGLAAGV